MLTLAFYLAVLVCAVALVAGHIAFWTWYYRRPRVPDERHYLRAPDGWTLALARLRPDPEGPAAGVPLICCPGLACNARLFDFDDEHSLGRHLAARGFDVWILDLRGNGESQKPDWLSRGWSFGFEELVRFDAVSAVDYVVRATGRERLFWVGHSMGGLVGYDVAARYEQGRHLAGVVSIGSPLDFSGHRESLGWSALVLDRFLRFWPVVRLGRLCRFVAPFAGRLRTFPETLFLSGPNVPGESLRRYLVEVIEDVPRKLLDQFADAILRGRGFDGRPAAEGLAELKRCAGPVLAISGNVDRVAPPLACRTGARFGSADVTEVVMGHDEEVAFGHGDLIIGEAAPRTVYPLVADWLLARASTRATSSAGAPDACAAVSSSVQPA